MKISIAAFTKLGQSIGQNQKPVYASHQCTQITTNPKQWQMTKPARNILQLLPVISSLKHRGTS
jgi:hypothetical protein